MIRSAARLFASSCLAVALASTGWATDPAAPPEAPAAAPTAADITKLKEQVEEQQKQLDKLRAALDAQLKMLEQAAASASAAPAAAPAAPAPPATDKKPYVGDLTASTTPIVQPEPARVSSSPYPGPAAARAPFGVPYSSPSPQTDEPPSPLSLRIGDSYLTPVGFMDMTAVFRSASEGTGIGTNFGSIPFNNSFPNARLTETRLSIQNSRLGARFDTKVHGAKVTGYWESDFLGNPGSNNLSTTSNSYVFRMRLYWVDVRKDKFEVLGGQSWSLLTPGRNGISPLPGDLFYSQVVDVNYSVGLTWGRIPQFRFVYHPSGTVAAAVSFENADQYIGGSGGGGNPTLPTALPSTFVNQLDNAANYTQTPNLIPDIIGKLAFDPKTGPLHQHIEIVGLYREFHTYNQNNNNHYNSAAGGASVNMNFELAKNFHAIVNTFWSDGGGRYLFGGIPDLAIRPDGSISPIHAYSTLDGFEFNPAANTLLYTYFGETYGGKDVIVDSTGKPIGYGFTGSSNGNNRSIQELTFGSTQTLWRDAKWGALQLMFQYAWYNRYPWYVATGQPKDAHNSTIFLNLRYSLPGSAPSIK
ncbi:MAG: hypothetical protein ACLQU1_33350 [Bryobacteraceae bacterium]